MLAPHELKNKAFGKSLKGYNTAEVDDYIDFLIDKYTEVYRENLELDRKLRIVVTNLDEIRDEEESIRSTLVSAQKMGEKIIRDANERADIITESIKKRCDAVISDFKKQIAVEKEELWNVRATVLDFKKRLFEIYRRQIEDVQSISVNELEQLVLPSDSELVGKIFGEVKATIEEEVRSEHMRREQEEIIRRAEAESRREQEMDESELIPGNTPTEQPVPAMPSADEMPVEEPDDELKRLLDEADRHSDNASEVSDGATRVMPDLTGPATENESERDGTDRQSEPAEIPAEAQDEGDSICSEEELFRIFSDDDDDD